MKNLFLTLTVVLFGYSASAQNTTKLLNEYISIKNAMISGDSKAVSEAANTFYQSIKDEKEFTQKSDLLKATEKLKKESSIEKQRAQLNGLSTVMWKLVSKSDNLSQTIYYQYCPMKKAYCLSKEKEIKNPYYGSSMLTCGKVVETKK